MLDKPLAAFIQLYKPAYFQRVGLRYLNIVSRTTLDLEDVSWRGLFTPAYPGPHGRSRSGGGPGRQLRLRHAVQAGFQLPAKIHAGIGRLKTNIPNAPQDPEVKFIFDMDLSMGGNTACGLYRRTGNPPATPPGYSRGPSPTVCGMLWAGKPLPCF